MTFFCISCQENQDGHTWKVISFHSRREQENKNHMLAKVFLNSHFLRITVFYQNKPSFKNETSSLHWRNNLHYVNQFTFPTLQTNASRRTKIVRILLAAFLLLAPKTPNSCNKSIRNRAEPMLSTLESQSGISVTAQIIQCLLELTEESSETKLLVTSLSQQKGRFRQFAK